MLGVRDSIAVTETSLCSALPTHAENVALPAFAVSLSAAARCCCAAIDRYILPSGPTAANPQPADKTGEWDRQTGKRTDGHTEGQTPYRFIHPAPHTMPVVPIRYAGFGDFCDHSLIRGYCSLVVATATIKRRKVTICRLLAKHIFNEIRSELFPVVVSFLRRRFSSVATTNVWLIRQTLHSSHNAANSVTY